MPIKPHKGTQEYKLLEALKITNVTTLNAMKYLGICSLHRRLTDLKQRGYEISSTWEKNPDTGSRYKVYRLVA